MRKPKRDIEIFNMSFLDVISCGFGAVILLLVVALAFEPTTVETITRDLRGLISTTERTRQSLVQESQKLSRELAAKKKSLIEISQRLTSLDTNWSDLRKQLGGAQAKAEQRSEIEKRLTIVQQKLTDEMKRLLRQPDYRPPGEDAVIGGIPVDSEFIIFVIDTSGSMKMGAWPLVVKKVQEILSVYPKVKGIQVLNDMGTYMFATYSGQWIPDTPARRRAVVNRLKSWMSFSNSNPKEGVIQAVQTFYNPNHPTSIFVFGDDFNGRSIDNVIRTVARINRKNLKGRSQVRIHTFGFPVLFGWPSLPILARHRANFVRFAHLMRLLAEQNSGTFVGLNSIR